MEIKKASESGDNVLSEISGIFSSGFFQWLKYFSKDEKKLSRAFTHMFLPEAFYVADDDGKIAGIAACTDGKTPPVRLIPAELRRHLGLIKGSVAAAVLKKQFENHPYPFPLEPDTGSIEFVATGTDFRGKGVASAIIRHIISETSFNAYVLEVADTNTPAVRLYGKLGFEEFMRVPVRHGKKSGINNLVYMKYRKEK